MRLSQRVSRPLVPAAVLISAAVAMQAALPAQARSSQAAPALVKMAPARILTTAQGMTLYVYAPDKKNKSMCYGECAEYWPPMIVAPGVKPPAALPGVAGAFGVTMRTNGKHQLTYNGAPLYTFIKDKKPGQMAGQGLDVAGGYWWAVVTPSR